MILLLIPDDWVINFEFKPYAVEDNFTTSSCLRHAKCPKNFIGSFNFHLIVKHDVKYLTGSTLDLKISIATEGELRWCVRKLEQVRTEPPFFLFNAKKFHHYRIYNNHRLAMEIKYFESPVLRRLRKKARKYTSKIFLWFLKCMCAASTFFRLMWKTYWLDHKLLKSLEGSAQDQLIIKLNPFCDSYYEI